MNRHSSLGKLTGQRITGGEAKDLRRYPHSPQRGSQIENHCGRATQRNPAGHKRDAHHKQSRQRQPGTRKRDNVLATSSVATELNVKPSSAKSRSRSGVRRGFSHLSCNSKIVKPCCRRNSVAALGLALKSSKIMSRMPRRRRVSSAPCSTPSACPATSIVQPPTRSMPFRNSSNGRTRPFIPCPSPTSPRKAAEPRL